MDFISLRSIASGLALLVGVLLTIRARSEPNGWDAGVGEQWLSRRIAPKVVIISFFSLEGEVWHDNLPQSGLGNLNSQLISVPGLSPQYPQVRCTADGSICQLTTGMSEINAATSVASFVLSHKFDLRKTYFLLAGIAGVNPKRATLGSVALARFAVQVALQYEIDPREAPEGWDAGYFSFGTEHPREYPAEWYGTEVFELNSALRDVAFGLASKAKLNDSQGAREYRAKYTTAGSVYEAASGELGVLKCDMTTSDVFFSGEVLGDAFDKTTSKWTGGLGEYCMSAMEDNAVLETLTRFHVAGLVDYSRAILLRTGSNFDRPPPGHDVLTHLRGQHLNGVEVAISNIYLAGIEIIKGIVGDWEGVFSQGIKSSNYLGDVLGTLGGTPDFIPERVSPGMDEKKVIEG